MKRRTDVPRLSVLFVSVFLMVTLCGVFSAEAQQINLNAHGDVVWHESDGNDDEIFLYSKGNITQITDNDYHDQNPRINSKGQIVWQGWDGNDQEIFLYSEGTITQITDNDYNNYNPEINSEGQIVWHGFDGNNEKVFLYSKGAITQITDKVAVGLPDSQTGWEYVRWTGRFRTERPVYSSPAIGSDGTIYVGSDDHNLYAINPNGTQKWAFKTGGNVPSSPAIGSDGTIYVGSGDGFLYAFSGYASGPANSPWPMFKRNAAHTGCVP